MDLIAAQSEARRSFVGGGPGVFVSGLVWLAAAFALTRAPASQAFAVLFFGGMLISPVSTLIERQVFRRPPPSRENVLVALGLETAIAMIACLIAAYLMMRHSPELAFPVAAMAIGTRYFSFATLFGNRLFWGLGALITAIGATSIWGPISLPIGPAFGVAAVELTVGLALTAYALRRNGG